MENKNGSTPSQSDAIPTATISDSDDATKRASVGIEGDQCLMTLETPDGRKFALAFGIKVAAIMTRLCAKVIGAWHYKNKGVLLMMPVNEASVSGSDEYRNHVAIQFELGIAYMLPTDHALTLSELLKNAALGQMTEDQRLAYNQKIAPLIVQPRHRLIKPGEVR